MVKSVPSVCMIISYGLFFLYGQISTGCSILLNLTRCSAWPNLYGEILRSLLYGQILQSVLYGHICMVYSASPGGSEWIISVGDYVNNSFTALGSSDPGEVRLEL